MAYCSVDDLSRWIDPAELVGLCTRTAGAAVSDPEVTAVAGEAIRAAEAEIDSYLLGRWPGLRDLSPVPEALASLSARLAVYYLYLRRRAVSQRWRECYEDCRGKLEQAASGNYSLGLGGTGAVAASPESAWRTDSDTEARIYTEEKLRKF